MKRIYSFLILLIFGLKIFANPLISSYINISELLFDASGNWQLELEFYHFYHFETSESGEYSTRTYSRPVTFHHIVYTPGKYEQQAVPIAEINYVMEPDSIIERNIYLLDTLMTTGLNSLTLNNMPVKIYPNPVSVSDKLQIEIDLPVKTSDIWIEITSLDGKLIKKEKIQETKSLVEAPNKNGIYILGVLLDKKIISSYKITVTHE